MLADDRGRGRARRRRSVRGPRPTFDGRVEQPGHPREHLRECVGHRRIEVACGPVAIGAPDVFVVHEELGRVDELVDRRDAHRVPDRRAGADGLDEFAPLRRGDRRLHLRGMVGERGDHDAGRTVEPTFPHDEVGGEITCRPLTAQRGGIGADREEEVAEFPAFDLCRIRGRGHLVTVPPIRPGPDVMSTSGKLG